VNQQELDQYTDEVMGKLNLPEPYRERVREQLRGLIELYETSDEQLESEAYAQAESIWARIQRCTVWSPVEHIRDVLLAYKREIARLKCKSW
jgi:hypothetical protein